MKDDGCTDLKKMNYLHSKGSSPEHISISIEEYPEGFTLEEFDTALALSWGQATNPIGLVNSNSGKFYKTFLYYNYYGPFDIKNIITTSGQMKN